MIIFNFPFKFIIFINIKIKYVYTFLFNFNYIYFSFQIFIKESNTQKNHFSLIVSLMMLSQKRNKFR